MTNDKKVPCMPPIFHDKKFVTNFSKKANLFNSFFPKQCSIVENNSVLPASTIAATGGGELGVPVSVLHYK